VTRSGGVHAERKTGVKDCITRYKTAKLWRGLRAWLRPDRTQCGFKLLQMRQCVLPLGLRSTLDAEAHWGRQTDARWRARRRLLDWAIRAAGHSVRVLLDPAARLELGARWVNS